jgi:hypothetical protein
MRLKYSNAVGGRMSKCTIRGCRNLEWKCKDCGRIASTAQFGDKWISVKDEYPKFGVKYRYLFINGKRDITYGYAYPIDEGWDTGNPNNIWINDMDNQTNEVAIYWMQLPEPPNE